MRRRRRRSQGVEWTGRRSKYLKQQQQRLACACYSSWAIANKISIYIYTIDDTSAGASEPPTPTHLLVLPPSPFNSSFYLFPTRGIFYILYYYEMKKTAEDRQRLDGGIGGWMCGRVSRRCQLIICLFCGLLAAVSPFS